MLLLLWVLPQNLLRLLMVVVVSVVLVVELALLLPLLLPLPLLLLLPPLLPPLLLLLLWSSWTAASRPRTTAWWRGARTGRRWCRQPTSSARRCSFTPAWPPRWPRYSPSCRLCF